ncbi:MAG TPA: DUF4126 domain-containing protein [Candidatus Angelobacter sp.]|nr:DUF4126 domain-containing protein [Candidatus Angelobacter sp.]
MTNLLLALATGVGLAAATGLRAFLPLLAVGLAGRHGLLHLHPGMEWLESDPALWSLAVATTLELIGDKVPVVDHALDAVGTIVRPVAAWIATYAVFQGWGTPWAQLLAVAMGVGTLAVHGAKANTRLGSTALSLGHANPILSVLEDAIAFALVAAAILLPLVALAFVTLAVVVYARRRARRAG